jgi:hypothetical protein
MKLTDGTQMKLDTFRHMPEGSFVLSPALTASCHMRSGVEFLPVAPYWFWIWEPDMVAL